jgi:hypothetical protein
VITSNKIVSCNNISIWVMWLDKILSIGSTIHSKTYIMDHLYSFLSPVYVYEDKGLFTIDKKLRISDIKKNSEDLGYQRYYFLILSPI